jgi:hypothetical protein
MEDTPGKPKKKKLREEIKEFRQELKDLEKVFLGPRVKFNIWSGEKEPKEILEGHLVHWGIRTVQEWTGDAYIINTHTIAIIVEERTGETFQVLPEDVTFL